jgi:hypothetical protein
MAFWQEREEQRLWRMVNGRLADALFDNDDVVAFDKNDVSFWEYDSYNGRGDNIQDRHIIKRKRKRIRSAAESDPIPNAYGCPSFTAAVLALFSSSWLWSLTFLPTTSSSFSGARGRGGNLLLGCRVRFDSMNLPIMSGRFMARLLTNHHCCLLLPCKDRQFDCGIVTGRPPSIFSCGGCQEELLRDPLR